MATVTTTARRRAGAGLELRLAAGAALAVEPIEDGVLRVRFSAGGAWPRRRPWAVTDLARPAVDTRVTLEGPAARVQTASLDIRVTDEGALSVLAPDGREIVSAPGVAWEADSGRGRAAESASGGRTSWTMTMPPDRRYFGFGERTGQLEKRGRRYTCWTTDEWRHQGSTTDSLYVAVPYFLALDPDGASHGVFMDTTFRSAIDLSEPQRGLLRMEVEAPHLDWFLLAGPTPAKVLEQLTRLVGRHELPARWALGYHQARWSYASDAEVRDVAAALRRHRIPCDAVHLDVDHMDRFRPFTWDVGRFPDPRRLTADLRDQGFRTTVVVDAALPLAHDYDIVEEARERDLLLRDSPGDAEPFTAWVWGGRSVFPDHARPRTGPWWGALYRRYLDDGVAGFLNDMNEPAMHDLPLDDPRSGNTEPPPELRHGDPDDAVPHAEFRNAYALAENRATAEALRAARPRERPFVVSRSGFAGVQRHALVWTGDNWSHWEHLEMSLPQLLNLGLSGIALAGADIGGFFESCTPELLVRWTQLGALYPFARNNSARGTAHQEPWSFGEPMTARCRRAIELRYRLLPYLGTVVEEAVRAGCPVLRPLWFHHADDPASLDVGDQALLGRDLLLAPVVRPGKEAREVYLPPGGWYDVRTGAFEEGAASVLASATLDEDVPLFARAGAIVPTGPVMQWTDERPLAPLTLDVYLDSDGRAEGELYEDDGSSTDYRDGAWTRTRFEALPSGWGTLLRARREAPGAYEPPARSVEVVAHGPTGTARSTIEDAAEWSLSLDPAPGR